MTLYIYRVGWTYPARNSIYRSKSIKIPSCTRTLLGPVKPVRPVGRARLMLHEPRPVRPLRSTGRTGPCQIQSSTGPSFIDRSLPNSVVNRVPLLSELELRMYVLVVLLLLFVDKLGVWAVWLLADEPHTSGKIWQENAQHARFVVSTTCYH